MKLFFDELDGLENIVKRPTRSTGNDLRPDLLGDCIARV